MMNIPYAADQPDNATRIKEKKFGLSFHPFKVTEDELLSAVDELVNDQELKSRLKIISEELQKSKENDGAADRIVEAVQNFKTNS